MPEESFQNHEEEWNTKKQLSTFRQLGWDLQQANKENESRNFENFCKKPGVKSWTIAYRLVISEVNMKKNLPDDAEINIGDTVSAKIEYSEVIGGANLETIPCINQDKLFKVWRKMSDKKVSGPYAIPNKAVEATVRIRLVMFIQTCLHEGIFPKNGSSRVIRRKQTTRRSLVTLSNMLFEYGGRNTKAEVLFVISSLDSGKANKGGGRRRCYHRRQETYCEWKNILRCSCWMWGMLST